MAETKKKLGRGLNSLLSSTRLQELEASPTVEEELAPAPEVKTADRSTAASDKVLNMDVTGRVMELPLNAINRNPHQPRQHWDDEKLYELSESIRHNGLIQPILVRPMGEGYQLIAGERRLRATEMAGKGIIPAIIKDASEEQMMEWALVENIHRADLSAMERATAYQSYIRNFSLSQQEAAERLGEDRATIANYMRLLELPTAIKQMIDEGRISMGHGRALLGVKEEEEQIRLAQKAASQKMSVRELEKRVQQLRQLPKEEPEASVKSANVMELERDMTRSLGTKVSIKPSGKKGSRGRIVIEYYSLDDFDRIRERLF